MKNGFVFYRFYYEAMQGLDNESKGACLDALAKYIFEGEKPQLVIPEAKLFFTLVKPQIDANNQRFENGCKGGRPKKVDDNHKITEEKPKQNQNKTETKPNVTVLKEKTNKKEKISFLDVFDWKSLFTYWEENKKGGKYKNDESRERMLAKLKELTHNDLEFAKAAICHAIDNNYQGFCNGNELYFKGKRQQWKTIETDKPNAYDEFSEAIAEMKRRAQQ